MKKVFFVLIGFAVVLVAIMACSKTGGSNPAETQHVDENDDIFPVVTISMPLANQVYANGDSIIIEGSATDEKGLYRGKIILSNDLSASIVKEQGYEIHFLKSHIFRIAHKTTVSVATDFTVTAEFEDHGLNKTTKKVKVKVNL